MLKRLFIFLFVTCLFLMACEDILEEVDISNQRITVFAPLEDVVLSTNTVNFNWDTVEDADSYRFQLATPDFQAAQQLVLDSIFEVDSLGKVSTQVQIDLLNGNYTWRIKAMNSGFETDYVLNSFRVDGDENVDLIPPNIPQLVSPSNGTVQDNTEVSFSWTREDVPGTAEFDSIFFYGEESLTNLLSKGLGANKSYSATVSSGTYYWVVKAYDTAGNESEESEVFSFTIN